MVWVMNETQAYLFKIMQKITHESMSSRNSSQNFSKNDFMPNMQDNSVKENTPTHLLFYT